jgi:hypothetical protein
VRRGGGKARRGECVIAAQLAIGLNISSRQICTEETLMSKGPGRVQRVVLGLIAADPDGVFTIADLCRHAYPDEAAEVAKKHRVAVICALRRMALPGTWWIRRLRRAGSELSLFDPCSDESQTRVRWLEFGRGGQAMMTYDRWKELFPYLVEQANEAAAYARRRRDASPVEKLDIQIADAQQMLGMMKMAGTDPALMRRDAERLVALQAERAKLTAA